MIQKLLNTEELSYSSNLNIEYLKNKIENLFEQPTLRVAGKLTNEDEFTVYDKTIVVGWNMPSVKRKAAYLYGKITKGEKGTLVKVHIKPNSLLPTFAILATLVGVVISTLTLSNIIANNSFLILGLVFILLGAIYYPVSTVLRNRLRNKFVKFLDLSKV